MKAWIRLPMKRANITGWVDERCPSMKLYFSEKIYSSRAALTPFVSIALLKKAMYAV